MSDHTRDAVLRLTGWHGYTETPIVVVGETPKRYRITPPEGVKSVRLAGPRYVHAGELALVPKGAVRFTERQ